MPTLDSSSLEGCPWRVSLAGLPGLALLISTLLLATACGGAETPEGGVEIDEFSEVGDCLGPDPAHVDRFVSRDCDDADATVEIIEMKATRIVPTIEASCPPGTDLLLDAKQGPLHEGQILGLPETWCLRNLEPPHPGDLGMGGGELLAEDCFTVAGTGEIDEIPCDGPATAGTQYRLLAIVGSVHECPAGTTDPLDITGDLLTPEVLCGTAL